MAVRNADVARILDEVADVLELEGANPFRVRAYRKAARTVEAAASAMTELVRSGADLRELPGIGDDLAEKIAEIVRTGRLAFLEKERKRLPRGAQDLLRVEGLGPKRVRRLQDELGIRGLKDLERAAAAGKVRGLPGFGAKIEDKVLRSLGRVKTEGTRRLRAETEPVAEALAAALRGVPGCVAVEAAGSLRRRRETVGDLDIVAAGRPGPLMTAFAGYEDVAEVVSAGPTRSTVRLRDGLQVDLRVVEPRSFGAALLYLTGSKAHNVALRRRAQTRGWKLNEYGLFDGTRLLAGKTEAEVYRRLGLAFVEPELREDQGEVEAAGTGRLPRLVELGDLRGDLHSHTDATDGRDTLAAMAKATQERGLSYLAITDHSPRTTIAHGMDAKAFRAQGKAIDRLNDRLDGFTLLKGAEVDILKDGRLDLPDDLLREIDVVVASLHHREGQSGRELTGRILKAMENRHAHILGHPTGRLLGERAGMDLDWDRILDAASDGGWVLEVDGQPPRLDLPAELCRRARERKVPVAVSSDAHSVAQLGLLRFGVEEARRGWLEAGDVVNTLPLERLRKRLER